MFKKTTFATLIALALVVLPLTASAAEFMCSSTISFDPQEISINRDEPELAPVLMTFMLEGETTMCNYQINLYNPNGDLLGNTVNPESIIDMSSGNLIINFENNNFLENEMKEDGVYTLEIYDQQTKSIKGTLDMELTSGSVLGVSHQRNQSTTYYILAASILFAGGVGFYIAKKKLNN